MILASKKRKTPTSSSMAPEVEVQEEDPTVVARIAHLSQEEQILDEEIGTLTHHIRQLDGEIGKFNDEIAEYDESIRKLRRQILDLHANKFALEDERMNASSLEEQTRLGQEINKIETSFNNKNILKDECQVFRNDVQAKREAAQTTRTEREQRLDSVKAELEQKRKERAGLTSARAAALSVSTAGGKRYFTPDYPQLTASDLAKADQTLRGAGYLPTFAHFDPLPGQPVFAKLRPSAADIARQKTKPLFQDWVFQESYMLPTKETKLGGTQPLFSSSLKDIAGVHLTGSSSFNDFFPANFSVGFVTGESMTDFAWTVPLTEKHLLVGLVELKGADISLLFAIRQAAGCASNVAMGLLSLGMPREDVIVPTVGCNGQMIIFGATVLLEPAFPVFVPVSKELSLTFDEQEVQAYFERYRAHVGNIQEFLQQRRTASSTEVTMQLDETEAHFVKRLDTNALKKGLYFLTKTESMMAGLFHMFRALNKLYAHEPARSFVVFPLAVRTPSTKTDNHCLVFPNMTTRGFQIGTPHKLHDRELFDIFIAALEHAVSQFHAAGVLHVDLYPSNIMWKATQSNAETGECIRNVEIKVIDWDVAHCLDEEDFRPKVRKGLEKHIPGHPVTFGPSHDLMYVNALKHDPEDQSLWDKLADPNDNLKMNVAFFELLKSFLASTELAK